MINCGLHGQHFSYAQELRVTLYKLGIVWNMPLKLKLWEKAVRMNRKRTRSGNGSD